MSPETTSTPTSAPTSTPTSAPTIRYAAVTFDCPDPAELARFYGDALGLPVAYSTDDFILLGQEGSAGLGFNRLADYRRPTWPDPSQEKQAHIELGVDDLDAAQSRLVALGAVKPATQPESDRWRVLLDPAGHPFCITTLA
ncbi:VOC family protein [Streptomyces sp. NBC_00536]|uniref:VOC family protein n=1 Tax=Streptomyces sp. NBC_00536 TaxID=2975769 RepID=UPI002E80B512|nr:VOC family protein [Streptomyces sp. NBC_00536]WUC83103.1 VOC family protein [Streptomyces sp. NBC_00536]